jgi:hypothetical protein
VRVGCFGKTSKCQKKNERRGAFLRQGFAVVKIPVRAVLYGCKKSCKKITSSSSEEAALLTARCICSNCSRGRTVLSDTASSRAAGPCARPAATVARPPTVWRARFRRCARAHSRVFPSQTPLATPCPSAHGESRARRSISPELIDRDRSRGCGYACTRERCARSSPA